MKGIIITCTALSILTSSCLGIAWKGYKKPAASDMEAVNACFTIGKQNLNPDQWTAIKEAANDVCEIFYSQEFRQRVVSKTWLASCNKADTISGEEVYRLITKSELKFSVHPRKPWNGVGQVETDEAEPQLNRMAIDTLEFYFWNVPVDNIYKSELVNTLAHEVMHIVSERFLDYDLKVQATCREDELVSYGIGNLVEELWLKRHGK